MDSPRHAPTINALTRVIRDVPPIPYQARPGPEHEQLPHHINGEQAPNLAGGDPGRRGPSEITLNRNERVDR